MPPEKDLRHIFAYTSKAADAVNEEDSSINFVVSTDKLDRHGEIVEPNAVVEAAQRKGEFADNPIALACHLHRLADGMPPAVGSWDVESLKVTKHRVEMRLRFAVDTKLGEEYWKLYKARHMRAVSIGFHVLDGHEEKKDDKRFYIITRLELYEISCVAVGANPQALLKLKQFYSPGDSGDNFGGTGKAVSLESIADRIENLDKLFEALKSSLVTELDEIKILLIADQGGLAEGLLSGKSPSESLVTDGDYSKAGLQLERIRNILKGDKDANT